MRSRKWQIGGALDNAALLHWPRGFNNGERPKQLEKERQQMPRHTAETDLV